MEKIIKEMIEAVEQTKEEIFNISEEARTESLKLIQDLEATKEKVLEYIEEGDQLDREVRQSRQRLSHVSQQFDRYSEEDIRRVYEETHQLQTKLIVLQQEEKTLRQRRDDLERRILVIDETLERGEEIANKISVILPYLTNDFKDMTGLVEDAQEKQAFSLRIIQAQEEERRKLSREIHDGPAQMLANVLLRSELVERALRERTVEDALYEIKDIRKMLRRSLYEVRRIIYDLRPMALDDLGLVPTLNKYTDTIAEYNKIAIEFRSIGKEMRLPQAYEVAFFRLVQESIQNALKHAKPTLIQVQLEMTTRSLSLIVTDNGIGFDPTVQKEKSFGIIGMQERVEMLGGQFKIDSTEQKGTRISIKVPLK